ncbi:type I restriction enzyme HsdR N-terminal domain-containing protein [Fodinibius sediminis]|uniref:Type I restriction enzyme R protein N terminus (HSDR_N) n=1 Tax=Fodinibius sediminis TaxID=1214077 RepID=A0A521AE19_9BACT|nr:type I restriction enzyme HsdR N-terminal domain-containing protein [Fodinibius sediminis]SMO33065.1 Type I restriction enzyme R protein N terminus (HSDR_N) [Fodinibius sediminis]
MKSIATFIYPRVVWREGRKMLWNPIHRQPMKNRPEERVRLRIIEYLLLAGWSIHRISTEEKIGKLADTGMRTDIICYSQEFEPRILVECKAEHIPITRKTAEQVARYNQQVGSPYLLMSNGIADFWYVVRDGQVEVLDKQPDFLYSDGIPLPDYGFKDWDRRGFAGAEASPALRKWLVRLLPGLWHEQAPSNIRFLTFSQQLIDLDLSHYYLIKPINKQRRLALTTLTTAYGGSRMVAILNENNNNRGVIEINLDLLFEGAHKNSTIYSEAGTCTIDVRDFVDLPDTTDAELLTEQIPRVFLEYLE